MVAAFYRPTGRFVDSSGRYAQVIVIGKHEYGQGPSQAFVHRLRGSIIPAAGFPAGTRALAGGGPPQGVDFLNRAYGYFPWLVLGVLVLTYVLLLRAFRSLLLPLKAVLLNLLSVAAAYGILVVVFRWGAGSTIFGLYQYPQIEGWIPIFLFAMLFGLSMDYEVFLVTRMRETWDRRPRQHASRRARARADGSDRDCRGHRHGGRLLGLRLGPDPWPAGVRFRAGGGDPPGRNHHPRDPRPLFDGDHGPLELVAACQAWRAVVRTRPSPLQPGAALRPAGK